MSDKEKLTEQISAALNWPFPGIDFNFSQYIGSQVQKPLALVVVGGILLAPVLILIILPVLIDVFSRRGRRAPEKPAPESELDT